MGLRFGISLLALVAGLTSLEAGSQPTVLSPADVARLHQYSTVSDNFVGNPAYDFERPIELLVRINHLHTPDGGYGQIVFTVEQLGEGTEGIWLDPEQQYIATLQVSTKVKAKGLLKKDFSNSAPAVLLGWPATDWNQTNSRFLVDELVLLNKNQRLVFHSEHPSMKKHPNAVGFEN